MKKPRDARIMMESPREILSFDLRSGSFDLIDIETGYVLVSQATAGFNEVTMKERAGQIAFKPVPGGYTFTSLHEKRKYQIDLTITQQDATRIFVLEAAVTNNSESPLPLQKISPFQLDKESGSALLLERPSIYVQGFHSWNESRIYRPADYKALAYLTSHWMTVLQDAASRWALMLGFLTFSQALSEIRFHGSNECHLLEALSHYEGIALAPGKKLSSEKAVLSLAPSGRDALEEWARLAGEESKKHTFASVPSGWCSWYHCYDGIDEAYILRNLELTSELPSICYFQIDDGYQKSEGDWLLCNEKFPSGTASLIRRIKEKKLIPGLWVAPFMVSPTSELFSEHPGWLIKDEKGKPAPLLDWKGKSVYGLDASNPEVCQWLHDIFTVMSREWGVELFKLDFLYFAALSGKRHKRTWTGAQCYRKGLETIREAVGDRLILGCGAPIGPSIGLVDAMRVSGDVGANWYGEMSALTAISNTLSSYFFHHRLWQNDPDCVIVRDVDTALSLQEVQTLASVVGLSGGIVSVSDDLERLSPERREIVMRLSPSYGISAVPQDLFVSPRPSVFDLRVERPLGRWHIVALINFSDRAASFTLPLPRLSMRRERYLIYDIWEQCLLGIYDREISFSSVPPHSTKLICIRSALDHPQILATSTHITCGAVELQSYEWVRKPKRLSLTFNPLHHRSGRLIFHIPPGYLMGKTECTAEECNLLPVDSEGLMIMEWKGRQPFHVEMTFL
ncbi:MAG: glycoside hydrolase family 36 protein [Vulcanimicrobiota bacterium]